MLKSVLETCIPRESIVRGTFNPEIFTAALSPVVKYYQGEKTNIDSIYTDANLFFTQGTYLTDGMKTTIRNVFARLSGDQGAPSVQRLETAFGGGKTHTLIACTHIANRGKELSDVMGDTFVSADVLPEPGSVKVVGIAGDELPVVKPIGNKLIPFTLWGEIAYQIGGANLYSKVKSEAESYASPGIYFFDEIFTGKKILILIDEIAQYAARLEVSQPGRGVNSVAAFLLSLCNYAQAHSSIAAVITLASTVNAFSEATDELKRSLQDISNGTVTDAMAEDIVTKSTKELMDVSVRTSLSVTPVQSNEISYVLAKRLFENIDMVSAKAVVQEYTLMYNANPSAVPAEASKSSYAARMLNTYPFHPSLIDFLNGKLAQVPNFQGTRGVLRTLALVVRCIWAERLEVPMIQVSDIDMRNVAICDEILSKTGKIPLKLVLNTDIGSVGSSQLADGVSISQGLDKDNPHPDGIPMYEKSWKVVFLNSLVGNLQDKVFGVTEQEAVLQAATPVLEMEQVRMALEAVGDNAFYLRFDNGRYYAHLDPTINSILSKIRQSVSQKQVDKRIEAVTQKLIKENNNFKVYVDVKYPQDIPDNQNKIEVGVISPGIKKIDVEEFFISKGNNMPRIQQNIVVLLLPKTAVVEGSTMSLFQEDLSTDRLKQRLNLLARQVIANDTLKNNPAAYGVTAAQLNNNPLFIENARKQAISLEEAVTELYKVLCYPDGTGYPCKPLRSAAGESGATILSEIQTVLEDNGELIRMPNNGTFPNSLLKDLARIYFFSNNAETIGIKEIEQNFYNVRRWPIVLDRQTLYQVIYSGLKKNIWVAFKMSDDPTDAMPAEIYWAEKEIPMGVDLFNGGYSLISYEGAKNRDWLITVRPIAPNSKIKEVITKLLRANGALKVKDIDEAVQGALGDNVPTDTIHENICDMVRNEGYALYYGDVGQKERPQDLIMALEVCSLTSLDGELVMISKAEMSVRGWFGVNEPGSTYSGIIVNNAELVFGLLGRLGSMYNRGKAKSTISNLDVADLKLADGGRIRFAMDEISPKDVKNLDELLADIVNCSVVDDVTEGSITIDNPEEGCALAEELRGAIK